MVHRVDSIELDQDLAYEERSWRIQRVGWVIILLLVVAALLGVFGSGPLSEAETGGEGAGLTVEYQRIIRRGGASELIIHFAPDEAVGGQVELRIDTAYLDGIEIQRVSPEPVEVRATGDRQVFVFLVDEGASEWFGASIMFSSHTIGRLKPELGVNDNDEISFTQVSLP